MRKKKKNNYFLKFTAVFIIVLAVILYLFFSSPHYWNGKDKISLVVAEVNNVQVLVFDPKNSEITKFIIPGDTQVNVAYGKGLFKLKNVWQLGIDEGLGGSLLSHTIVKNFKFPVFLWQRRGKTNLALIDRILLWFFKTRVKDANVNEIDLGKAMYVKRQKLEDGSLGYILDNPLPERLIVYFSDYQMLKKPPRVVIEDGTGTNSLISEIGRVIEIMGGKVISIEKKGVNGQDCIISGSNKNAVRKMSAVFSCQIRREKNGFDVKMKLGKSFAKRF